MEENGIYAAASAALDTPARKERKGEASPAVLLGDIIEMSPRESLCCHARLRGPSQAEIDMDGYELRCTVCGRAYSYGEER